MDRVSDATYAAAVAAMDRAALMPPDDLDDATRAMFLQVVDENKTRPWNAGHVGALVDYCRLVLAWRREFERCEREGAVVGTKRNPRLLALSSIGSERARLARFLGIGSKPRAKYLGVAASVEGAEAISAQGAAIVAAEKKYGNLLA